MPDGPPVRSVVALAVLLLAVASLAFWLVQGGGRSRDDPPGPTRSGDSAAATRPVPPRPDTAVRVFFGHSERGAGECEAVWPVRRTVEAGEHGARAALTELLEGPTGAERERGFFTNLPPGVGIRGVHVARGTARADFDRTLARAAGSCRVRAIRAQIERTLLHLPGVREVVISVEGDTATALQP